MRLCNAMGMSVMTLEAWWMGLYNMLYLINFPLIIPDDKDDDDCWYRHVPKSLHINKYHPYHFYIWKTHERSTGGSLTMLASEFTLTMGENHFPRLIKSTPVPTVHLDPRAQVYYQPFAWISNSPLLAPLIRFHANKGPLFFLIFM